MAEILKQNKIQITHYKFIGDSIPIKVTYFDNAPAKVILSDNNEIESSCVNCQELSCIKRDNSIIVFDELKSSQTDKICPTNAIEVSDSGNVSVDPESCIGCGLCIASCPIGAGTRVAATTSDQAATAACSFKPDSQDIWESGGPHVNASPHGGTPRLVQRPQCWS